MRIGCRAKIGDYTLPSKTRFNLSITDSLTVGVGLQLAGMILCSAVPEHQCDCSARHRYNVFVPVLFYYEERNAH